MSYLFEDNDGNRWYTMADMAEMSKRTHAMIRLYVKNGMVIKDSSHGAKLYRVADGCVVDNHGGIRRV